MEKQQEPAAGETLSESSPCPMDHPWTFTSSVTSFVTSTSSYFRVYIPSMEDSVKFSGGAIAALVAMRYAKSVHSAGLVGLLSGLFAHSFYADVLRKKRRRRGDKWQEINEKNETEEREEEISF